jgi:CheY-like chemotaxis protein
MFRLLVIAGQPNIKKIKKVEVLVMKKGSIRSFDLPALSRIDDLDIHMVIRENPVMWVNEYFYSLWKFINSAPNTVGIVNRIAALDGSEFDFHYMSFIKNILKSIGCYKFMPAIEEIIQSGKKDDYEYAASCAKKLSEDIYNLFTRIKKTEKKEHAETASTVLHMDGQPGSISGETLLSKAMELLEQKKAAPKMRILAVDDSPVMLKTISSALSDDYIVYGMTNPAMLKDFLQQITPELILLDIEMPEIDGFKVMMQLQASDLYSEIPVVFLSAMSDDANEAYGKELGAVGFIVKPFQASNLREKVAKYIVRNNLAQERAA